MIKIYQKLLSISELKKGIEQFQIILNQGTSNEMIKNINTSHIRLKINDPSQYVGLFLNNNPYLITPVFDKDGYWELDTKNNTWITSIKFDLKTQTSILIEAFYEEE